MHEVFKNLTINEFTTFFREGICPIPIWQGAFGHSVRDLDDDWALLDFNLKKQDAVSKDIPGFSWDQEKDSSFFSIFLLNFKE